VRSTVVLIADCVTASASAAVAADADAATDAVLYISRACTVSGRG